MTDPTHDVDCRAAVQQLWDFLDQELTEERMEAVRNHLARCEDCLPHHDFAQTFLAALQATRDANCKAPEALRRRVAERLREAGFTTRSS